MKLINVVGINDENRIVVEHNGGTLKQLSFRIEGNSGFLQTLHNDEFEIFMFIVGGEQFDISLSLPKHRLLFNSIGMAEGNKRSLKQFVEIMEQISNPVINHPSNVLLTSRDKIGKILLDIDGVIVPECLKIVPESIHDVTEFIGENRFDFPFLFRPLVEHGMQSLIRIDSPEEMEKLHRFAFDGENEFYVTRFLDFKSEDGLYRKMRFLIIGDEVIPRHLILSPSWQIHTENKQMNLDLKQQQILEEISFLGKINLQTGKRLLEIKKTLGLDYFGVDCAIDKRDNIVIFEANPFSMLGIGKEEKHHKNIIAQVYRSRNRLIRSKINVSTSSVSSSD